MSRRGVAVMSRVFSMDFFSFAFYDEEKGEQEGRKFFLLNQPEREHFCQHQVDAVRGISRSFSIHTITKMCATRGEKPPHRIYEGKFQTLRFFHVFYSITRALARASICVCLWDNLCWQLHEDELKGEAMHIPFRASERLLQSIFSVTSSSPKDSLETFRTSSRFFSSVL